MQDYPLYLRESVHAAYFSVSQREFQRKKEGLCLREKIGQAKQLHLGLDSQERIYRI